jgi:hypothetical protein
MSSSHASDNRVTVTTMRPNVLGALLLAVLALALAGCGGGGSEGSGGEETTATVTETTVTDTETDTETGGTTTGESTIEETDGSYGGDDPICKAVTNSSSPLNIAASTGDFATVSAEWAKLAADAPAAVKADVETVAEGYGKIATDPAGFGVMDTEPYKSALESVNGWTAVNCAQ